MSADFSRVVAIVPIRSLTGSKSRLGEPLDREGRNEAVNVLGSSRNVFAGLAHV